MDPRFLRLYNQELKYIREMGAEFAREFPKIAGRLGLEGFECADPYVERLLEGFAFLAARVQLKLEAEFPRFTQHMLEAVYPHYLAPTPSMAVVQFKPDLTEGALAEGFPIPRGTALRSILGKGDRTACEYRTAHDVTLWPLELAEAEYLATGSSLSQAKIPEDLRSARAGIRLVLHTSAGLPFRKLPLDSLPLYIQGSEELPMRIYEQIFANAASVLVRPVTRSPPWQERLDKRHIRWVGFRDEEALLPVGPRSFQGYRLLHEYFAFPARFLSFELTGLSGALRRLEGTEMEIIIVLNRSEPSLEKLLDASKFAMFCTPAANLFPKRADRIHLSTSEIEYHIVPDRTRPMDFEVHTVTAAHGVGAKQEEQTFHPLYALDDGGVHRTRRAYYVLRRERRRLSSGQRRAGPRTSYIGSELFVSLVDADEAPYDSSLKQLSVETLCTNRDLPLIMSVGKGKTDFTMVTGAPVDAVRILTGPSPPRPSWFEGETNWRLISHLTPHYLSLVDQDENRGATALRELLTLYSDLGDAATRTQIEGVQSVTTRKVTRPLPLPGPISFGRGLEIGVTCEESAFEGLGVFLLGAVLERYFARYVSINSFAETVLRTVERGEIMRWTTRPGQRHLM